MELGEKLLRARQEAGLSQRQLCGEVITRNMLSQIEHGTARPSMDTLRYLAGRLGKPVSFFLEEEPPVSEAEAKLLAALNRLDAGEQALREGREALALGLLSEPIPEDCRCREPLERRRLLLLGTLPGMAASACKGLPGLDEELRLRALAALEEGAAERALALLEAAEDRESPRWLLLHGRALTRLARYDQAVASLMAAEDPFPRETAPLLEVCFRELGDFQRAYEYACRQRE